MLSLYSRIRFKVKSLVSIQLKPSDITDHLTHAVLIPKQSSKKLSTRRRRILLICDTELA